MQQNLLDELVFKPGQISNKEDTVILPLLTIKQITHAISLGPRSHNMAESFNFDSSDLTAIQKEFLVKNGFSDFAHAYISGVPRPDEAKLIDIEKENLSGHALNIPAEGMFTKLHNIPLIHKPADCPTLILYAKDATDQQVLGLLHLGRPQVNNHVTEQALEHLEKHYGVDLATLTVGISPSIGPRHYFVKQSDQDEKNLIDLTYWGNYAYSDKIDEKPIIRIDVLGKILSILQSFEVPETNIQAYGHHETVDTFALASKNPPEAFSHRFAVSTNQPQKNGRIMIAAQL